MTFVMQRGCINDWLGTEDKQYVDMTPTEQQEITDYLFGGSRIASKITPEKLGYFLELILEECSDRYEMSDKPCECCGDITEFWTVDI